MCDAEDELYDLQRDYRDLEEKLKKLLGGHPSAIAHDAPTILDIIDDHDRGLLTFDEMRARVADIIDNLNRAVHA